MDVVFTIVALALALMVWFLIALVSDKPVSVVAWRYHSVWMRRTEQASGETAASERRKVA